MRVIGTIAVGLFFSLLIPGPSSGQSLAEVAAKEKARRKALTPGKVYTESDLRRAGAEAGPATATTPTDDAATPTDAEASPKPDAAPGAKDGAKPKSDDEVRTEKQKDWNDRVAKANEEISRLNADIASLDRAVGDLSQNLYGATRTAQLARLEEDKKQLAAAQKTLADLQEEGRRNSYR
jgi:hypothetical protein